MKPPIFLADRTCGRLAKWLRLLGFDCEFASTAEIPALVQRAKRENRILLTKNSRLVPQADQISFLFLKSEITKEQLKQVLTECDLTIQCEAFLSICSICNEALDDIDKRDVRGLVPPFVYATRTTFRRCPGCGRIYWAGTHKIKMIDKLKQTLDTPKVNHSN
ncbi:MAG: Mut7-C RNAse domain-containing protein [Candidatus Lernaella stagnicola]|nr:Mut7-C RNAse domain-containing protein [Candidatus Lernaella stagnicola]